jgi:hypothetical protein
MDLRTRYKTPYRVVGIGVDNLDSTIIGLRIRLWTHIVTVAHFGSPCWSLFQLFRGLRRRLTLEFAGPPRVNTPGMHPVPFRLAGAPVPELQTIGRRLRLAAVGAAVGAFRGGVGRHRFRRFQRVAVTKLVNGPRGDFGPLRAVGNVGSVGIRRLSIIIQRFSGFCISNGESNALGAVGFPLDFVRASQLKAVSSLPSPQKYTQHLLSGTPAFHDHAHVGVRSHAGATSNQSPCRTHRAPIGHGMHCNHPALVAAGSGADTFQHLSIAQL